MVLRGTVCRFKQNHMDSWVNEANYRVGFKQLSTTQNLVHKGESETTSRETNSIQFKSVKLQKATISPIRFITWVQYMPAHIPSTMSVSGVFLVGGWDTHPKNMTSNLDQHPISMAEIHMTLPESMLNLKFRPPKSVIFCW